MLSLCAFLAFQNRTLNYDITRAGQPFGEAKILIRITQDGGKRTDTKLTLKQNGKTLDMHTTQVWAFSGRPTLKIVQTFDAKGVEVGRTRIDFKATEAVATKTVDGKTEKTSIPIDPKSEIRDLTEFWFIRDEPTKGQPFEYLTFDATALKWEKAKSIFVGDEPRSLNGKRLTLRHISQDIGSRHTDIWLDEDGFPVISESSDKTKLIARL